MRRKSHLRNQSGLTLIELMVVLIILALFAGLVVGRFGSQVKKAEIDTARTQIQILSVSLDTFWLDTGSYPESLEELIQSSDPKWNGPYLRPERIPKDPWGNEYIYQSLEGGESFDLYSTGNDQKELRLGGEE